MESCCVGYEYDVETRVDRVKVELLVKDSAVNVAGNVDLIQRVLLCPKGYRVRSEGMSHRVLLLFRAVKDRENLSLNVRVECRVCGFGKYAAFGEGGADGNAVLSERHVRNHLELTGENLIDYSLVDLVVVALSLRDEGYNMPCERVASHHCGDFHVAYAALFAA